MVQMAILFDATRCLGCRACQVACKQWNDLEGEGASTPGSYENPRDLSPITWNKLVMKEVERGPKVDWLFYYRTCFHCKDADCEDVCPTEAISHTPEGFVVIDAEECTACGSCVDECPFDVMRLGDEAAIKCDACISRIKHDEMPACVKTCPALALTFGPRDELLREGKKRVQRLKDEGYSNAYLYGETERGGLNVLSVLDDSPDVYGLPEVS